MFKINDQTPHMVSEKYRNYLLDLYGYIKSNLNFDKDISALNLLSNKENSKNPLGNTAYYEPSSMSVSIYCDGRHIKDIMRSFAHELVHHNQNCNNQLTSVSLEDGYAQDEKYRNLEEDAYLNGNLHFRDWEDSKKKVNTIQEAVNDKLNQWTEKVWRRTNNAVMRFIAMSEGKNKHGVSTFMRGDGDSFEECIADFEEELYLRSIPEQELRVYIFTKDSSTGKVNGKGKEYLWDGESLSESGMTTDWYPPKLFTKYFKTDQGVRSITELPGVMKSTNFKENNNMREQLKKVILETINECSCSAGGAMEAPVGGMLQVSSNKPPKRKKKKAFLEEENFIEEGQLADKVYEFAKEIMGGITTKHDAEMLYLALKSAMESAENLYHAYDDPSAAEDTHKVRQSQNLEKIKKWRQ